MPEIIERVPCEYLDGLECPCGNATHLDGYDPCLPDGTVIEPDDAAWDGSLVRCTRCGRIFANATHEGEGEPTGSIGIVKGPDVTCRDCGLGGYVAYRTKRVKGERDVEPCPGGDDDFHHWIGVVRTTCTNPSHDHDEITDVDGHSRPTSNLCNDCSTPLHFDRTQGWYFHDSPDAAPCFLAGPNRDNPCTPADVA